MDLAKSISSQTCLFILINLVLLACREGSRVEGHGRLIDPPSRATMWRYGFNSNADYDDNSGYCGGRSQLWSRFEGRCGVCGDPWEPRPRAHERGGRFYDGTPVRHYQEGDVMNVVIGITANHMGWVEFRLCSYDWPDDDDLEYDNNGNLVEVTQACLDKHLLQMADGSGTRFYLPEPFRVGEYSVDVRLPEGVSCNKCLFQWKWNVANSWGTDPDGTSCLGCGQQEQFYACADIMIESDGWEESDYPPYYPEEHTTPPHSPPPPPPPPPRRPILETPRRPNLERPRRPNFDTPEKPDVEEPRITNPNQPRRPGFEIPRRRPASGPRYPPPQTYPPVFSATEYPVSIPTWNIPDQDNAGNYPDNFPDSRRDYYGTEWNTDIRPQEPELTTILSSYTPSSSPPSASTSSEKPSPPPTTTVPMPDRATTPRQGIPELTTEKQKTEWRHPVPSFWKWLLFNQPARQSRTRPVLKATSAPDPVSAGADGKRPIGSWWKKIMSLVEHSVWKLSNRTTLHPRPSSRSTAATTPTTTATTTTTPPMTTTASTTAANIEATTESKLSKLRGIAKKLEKMTLPIPRWLQIAQRTGPAFLFHSWDTSESTKEVPSLYDDLPKDHSLEEVNIVAYSGILGPLDFHRRKRMKSQSTNGTRNQLAETAPLEENDGNFTFGSPPYNEQAMHSADREVANQNHANKTRDILLVNEHGFGTVNVGLPFEASEENLFISPNVENIDRQTEEALRLSAVQHSNAQRQHDRYPARNPLLSDNTGRDEYFPVRQNYPFHAQEIVCTPVGGWIRYPKMWRWCHFHCLAGYCPPSHCMCV